MTEPKPPPVDWESACCEAEAHLKALLRIDTTNPPGNERPAADYVARVLGEAGIAFDLIESEPSRASLVARIEGSGAKAPLLLNGHLDVVPAEEERWKHPPFGAEEHDGCIWGRGAIDMKNMVAMSLMTVLLLHRNRVSLERDVIFAAVADEEAGSGLGARFLVDHHPELVRAEYVLNEVGGYTFYFGDTVFYPIQVAEKGICWFSLSAEGESGHGSMPRADNSVVRIAEAVAKLGRTRLPQHNVPVVEAFVRRLAESAPWAQQKAMPLLLSPRLAGPLLDLMARQDESQAAGIDAMLRNTASPTMLHAGKKVNVVPSSASATVDGRLLPGQRVEDFLDEVRRVVGEDLRLVVLEQHEGTVFSEETPLFSVLCEAIEHHHPGAIPIPFMIPGFTDSAAYADLGATCYGFSPVRLPPGMNYQRMYHGHDERIPIDGFRWGFRVLYDAVSRFCSAAT